MPNFIRMKTLEKENVRLKKQNKTIVQCPFILDILIKQIYQSDFLLIGYLNIMHKILAFSDVLYLPCKFKRIHFNCIVGMVIFLSGEQKYFSIKIYNNVIYMQS